jgi:hypothetical protein
MRKSIFIMSSLVLALSVVFVACKNNEASSIASGSISNDSLIRRGAYLVAIAGCDDCHSPKKMGPMGPEIIPELRLSGYPANRPIQKADSNVVKRGWALLGADLTSAAGPWGMSFAANLTSDATGIGNWTEDQFRKAFTEGKWKGMDGNRMLMPPMPWQNFRKMDPTDVSAIFAFLKSTSPVENVEPSIRLFSEL